MPPTKRKLKENDPQNTVCRKQVKPSPVTDASCGRRASKRSKKQTLFMKPNGRAHYGPNGTAREASVNGGLDSQLAWAKAIAESLATYAANNAAELPQGGQAGAREEMVLVGGGSPPAAAATATATAAAAVSAAASSIAPHSPTTSQDVDAGRSYRKRSRTEVVEEEEEEEELEEELEEEDLGVGTWRCRETEPVPEASSVSPTSVLPAMEEEEGEEGGGEGNPILELAAISESDISEIDFSDISYWSPEAVDLRHLEWSLRASASPPAVDEDEDEDEDERSVDEDEDWPEEEGGVEDSAAVKELMEMGFTHALATEALRCTADVEGAAHLLLEEAEVEVQVEDSAA